MKLPATIAAGKRINCPKCSGEVVVPGEIPATAAMAHSSASPPSSAMKSCDYCGEMILAAAKKCKHCGEFLEESAEASAPRLAPAARVAKAGPAKVASGDEPGVAEYFVAFALAPVGLIIGLVWLIKKQAKATRMLQVSALMNVILVTGAWMYFYLTAPEPLPVANANLNAGGPRPADSMPEKGFTLPGVPTERPKEEEQPQEEIDLEGMPPAIKRAMKANVLLRHEHGLGSGVVIQRDGDDVLILTNRHVVDPKFAEQHGKAETPLKGLPALRVTYYDKQSNNGKVIWGAPGEIDLAIVKTKAPKDIEPVAWQAKGGVSAGQDVFAVGNPLGMGWTHTKGSISQVRKIPVGPENKTRDVSFIQTDTSITFGNSGGGLYLASSGELIGINSSILDPRLGGKFGFAIRPLILLALKPPGLNLTPSDSPSSSDEPK